MAGAKSSYHHGDLRRALVDAAVELVEARGAEAFSLREAAREVGVSANATYRHFPDKRALLGAVARVGLDRLSQKMLRSQGRAARTGDPPTIARFKATGRAYVAFASDHPELFRLIFGPPEQRELAPPLGEHPSPYELLGLALDGLVEDGRLSASDRVGAELRAWTVVHGFAALGIGDDADRRLGSRRERAASLESLLDFVVRGLGVAS